MRSTSSSDRVSTTMWLYVSSSPPAWPPAARVSSVVDVLQGELAGIGIEIEELAVASPVDGDLQLAPSFLLGEPPAQQIEEEPLAQGAVLGGLQRLADGPHQGRPLPGPQGED